MQTREEIEYRCPGEQTPIGRAIHLGRLARFYPACRQCPHRQDMGAQTSTMRRQQAESRTAAVDGPRWLDDALVGVYPNQIGPRASRRLASAFGLWLRRRVSFDATPLVVLAGDGRARSAEVLAAAGEGLRWAGCGVVEIGPATSACLAFAMDHLQAAGGLLVGNPLQRAHTIGVRLRCGEVRQGMTGEEPIDWSRELDLAVPDDLETSLTACPNRPARQFGPHDRFPAAESYLAGLAEHYHGLRPLRFVLQSDCEPLVRDTRTLCAQVACQVIAPKSRVRWTEEVRRASAHFGLRVDDDGETASLVDERGEAVPAERLLLWLARYLLHDRPKATVVLEAGSNPHLAADLTASGTNVAWSETGRGPVEQALRRHEAFLAGGPSGRLWYAVGHPSPDALRTLTLLLVLLSRSDRRLSDVLDAEARLD